MELLIDKGDDSDEHDYQLTVMTNSVGAVTSSQNKEEFNKSLQGEQNVKDAAL